MKKDVIQTLKEKLDQTYSITKIEENGKTYETYLIPQLSNEDLNHYETILLLETKDKNEISYFRTKYKPKIIGYTIRLVIIKHKNKLYIIDTVEQNYIVKNLNTINKKYVERLTNIINNPSEETIRELFNRNDIIEDFYKLFNKTREYFFNNIKGLNTDNEKQHFTDSLLMTMMTLYYLQEKEFFDNDKEYFTRKFREVTSGKYKSKGINTYWEFLKYLFDKLGDNEGKTIYSDEIVGEIVITGPAPFIGLYKYMENKGIIIPDELFYIEGKTRELDEKPPRKVGKEVPLLNMLESRDWTGGEVNEYVIGAIYEKLMTQDEKKKTGSYYTPEEITTYISKNTIEPYLVDLVNDEFNKEYKTIDEVIENSSTNELEFLYENLVDIRILDPTVGSGHFLESTIDELVSIYEKLRDRLIKEYENDKKVRDKFIIQTVNENNDIVNISLLDIKDDEEFKLLIKFFIILSRNIYGVDINPVAIEVAKARLFLSLAKHFKKDSENVKYIRFPNLHFNLRVGNSIVGYIEPNWLYKDETNTKNKKKKTNVITLDLFMDKKKRESTRNDISVILELRPFLIKMGRKLKDRNGNTLSENIVDEINELNSIIDKQKLTPKDIRKVLEVKMKLTKIMIVSLNSKYSQPIYELIEQINTIFNDKLDELFIDEYNLEVTKEDLKRVGTFHWFFEFPEVILDGGGFDIVIGNPPYVRQEQINHIVEGINYKSILSKIYSDLYDSKYDISMYFIITSISLLNEGGYHSFIITNKWLSSGYGRKIRKYLKESVLIKKIIDFTGINVFSGVTVDTMIYITKNIVPHNNFTEVLKPTSLYNIIKKSERIKIRQDNLNDEKWILEDENIMKLKYKIETKGKPLVEWNVRIFHTIITGLNDVFVVSTKKRDEILSNCNSKDEFRRTLQVFKPVLRGRDISKWRFNWNGIWLIFIPWHFPLQNENLTGVSKQTENKFKKLYPALYNYLVKYREKLENRSKDEVGIRYEWYTLQRWGSKYYNYFKNKKIVWAGVGNELEMSIVCGEYFLLTPTNFMIVNNIDYITGVLNSNIIQWYYKKVITTKLGKNGNRFYKKDIYKIPIPPITEENEHIVNKIEVLVRLITDLSQSDDFEENFKKQKLVKLYEYVLNNLVYKLYDLTDEEIKIIEEEIKKRNK